MARRSEVGRATTSAQVTGAKSLVLSLESVGAEVVFGIPGGAIDSHETPATAALRESVEECAIDPQRIDVVEEVVTTDLPEWSYTTVIALCEAPLDVTANEESEELRWVALPEVSGFELHPGFAASLSNVLKRAMVHTEPHD